MLLLIEFKPSRANLGFPTGFESALDPSTSCHREPYETRFKFLPSTSGFGPAARLAKESGLLKVAVDSEAVSSPDYMYTSLTDLMTLDLL